MIVARALGGATYCYVESRGLKVAINKEVLAPTSHNAALHISRKMWSSTSYDGQGFWLAQKRLSKGRFRWWPEGRNPGEVARSLAAHQLQVLLAGGDPTATQAAPAWRPLSVVS
jgi:hypothetical protein